MTNSDERNDVQSGQVVAVSGQVDARIFTGKPVVCKGCGEAIDTELALGLWCKSCAQDKFGDARR